MTWGLSMALHEEATRDQASGGHVGADLAGYHFAAHADVPLIEADWVDDPVPDDPVGIKGIGEIGVVGVAAAIANAVWHATGVRHRDLPIRPDRVLRAADEARRRAAGEPGVLDIAEELNRWFEEGRDFAVATVVAVGGSAPRGPGAALAVDSHGTAIGSVSGGCVEGTVYDLCVQALQDGRTVRMRFGYSDEDAFAVGLTCGGVIEVLVTPVRADAPVFRAGVSAADRGEAAALVRVAWGPGELLGCALLVHPDGSYEEASTDIRIWTGRRRRGPARCWTPAAPAPSRSRRTGRAARAA